MNPRRRRWSARFNTTAGSATAVAFDSLGDFLDTLERQGELLRIRAPISRDLEIAELTSQVHRAGGPALLFENVTGASMPVVTNVLGTARRVAAALGATDLREVAERVGQLTRLRPRRGSPARCGTSRGRSPVSPASARSPRSGSVRERARRSKSRRSTSTAFRS